ncbi:MAG TPA: hypothetical protein DD706_10590 [Nitrospiraceae bacterium]|nr:hypothetical protein [Nitrospiraceae bacterium]
MKVFISYSHKDEGHRNNLVSHLAPLKRDGVIEVWHDRKIMAGQEWAPQIDKNLEQASIILLLISSDFLASDYCYDKEMSRALEKHHNGEARIIPIIIRSADWSTAPFAKIQALPQDGKPVTSWNIEDEAWTDVAKGIRLVVQELSPTPTLPLIRCPVSSEIQSGTFRLRGIRFLRGGKRFLGRYVTRFCHLEKLPFPGWEG